MHEEIKKVLKDLKNRPGIFIGGKSLKNLTTYISGYVQCICDRDKVDPVYFQGFQEFVEEYYFLKNNKFLFRNWVDIIEFFTPSEEDAFDEFYELLDEFLKNKKRNKEL